MAAANILEQTRKLVDLQTIDTKLFEVKRQLTLKPIQIEALQKEYDQKLTVLKEYEEKSKALLLKRKEKEGELAAKEEQISQLRGKLYSLKTNKEMEAMLSEIKGVEMDKSLLEEEILKCFDQQDTLDQEVAQQKERLKDEEGTLQAEKQKIQEEIKALEAEAAQFESKRGAAEKLIDEKMLAQYNRILKAKDGLAIAAVVNNSCQGCHINVTHQVINEIKMHDRLIPCESCARMLYIPDDIE